MNEEIALLSLPEVQSAIQIKKEALQLTAQAKEMHTRADNVINFWMLAGKTRTLKIPELGTFTTIAAGITETLDKAQLKAYLVLKGVDAALIQKAFDQATQKKPKKGYLSFRPKKTKK